MSTQRQAVLLGLATVLLWSTVASAFKIALRELTPVQLLMIATTVSVFVLLAILAAQGRVGQLTRLSGRQYLLSFGLGLVNPCLYYLILFAAFDRLPAQEAQPLNYTWALTLAYLSVPLLGHRLRPVDFLAGLVSYSGVWVIATRGDVFSVHFSDTLGVILALASTLVWALYWIANTRDSRDPVLGLFLNFLFAWPVIVAICLGIDGWPEAGAASMSAAVYVGVCEMGVAFVLWLMAMKRAEQTAQISNLIFISPFLSLVFIHFLVGEAILASTYVGLVLIVSGLLLQRVRRPRPRPAHPE
ncbi:DMT family transporter [Marinobacteraceae bacterium S3BR75-40.1]